jgi:hypothetical protein
MRKRRILFATILCALAGGAARAADDPADPLAAHRGARVVVEFPDLADVGRTLVVPAGWRYLAVTAATYDSFARHLDPEQPLALLYFDEHGNLVHRDHSKERIVRLERAVAEAERRIAAWQKRAVDDWERCQTARRADRAADELAILVALRETGVRGYPQIEEALARLAEVEGERLVELWGILAREGRVKRRDLAEALGELAGRCRGLALEARILRERARVERGWIVDGGPRAG